MSTPQICEDSFLEGYERTTAESDKRKKLCGGMAKDFKTFSNHVYLRLFATAPNIVPSFKALLTVYVPGLYIYQVMIQLLKMAYHAFRIPQILNAYDPIMKYI